MPIPRTSTTTDDREVGAARYTCHRPTERTVRLSEYAVNLIPLRQGVELDDFAGFSAEVDQPTLLAQDVVLGFDAYAITRRDESAPSVDIVEVMHVRSWSEWVEVRDNAEAIKPVAEGFEQRVDPSTVRTLFGTRIEPR
jgi:hypothetical protein